MKVFVKTFGCRTNIYDSELIKKELTSAVLTHDEKEADIIIVNSCTVTNGADSDVRNYINRANRLGKKVLLTGCGVVSRGKELFEKGSVFGVFGMSEKEKVGEFVNSQKKFFELGNLKFSDKNLVTSYENHTKAFIKIQEGCDFNCAYCIIPSVRGKSRSIDESLIINEAKELVANGFSEIVLTGTNIGSYGKDKNSTLGKLIANLGKIQGVKRIRLGSVEPSQIDSSFREILRESWFEKHLHIALQHTSQKMLSIMRRRNKALKDLELFCELAELGFALGTDFIVAHPGESEEIWSEAVENFKKFPITHIHAFIFSPRDNTHSATLPHDINGETAKKRLKMLQNIVLLNNLEFRKKHYNKFLDVLIERKNGEFYEGFDQFYNKILVKSNQNLAKKWVEIKKYEITTNANLAEI
ncbi:MULTISPECIES: tRNA (N(6)-L-threonylcarbamoyladenosine(37)-C(2))-methylthiotransferase MtaB [unclassified Campylobacter]|uniref:tRNA (N(6)-L-threonylcarbamoyladenosine(37)-C(2))- methylthiotransferase MtaB n=1 Tax=unclassified Campylobacter TaxID=2593542 RepID=UPI0022E9CA8E|nr:MULTISPECIES: tRNA (N(6)-L-threonylcarbamoyladenosine(37)-C(2))-methylthiotransferase MtaB [unclassified Campylobacter]MDA3055846.1 tRNA (N(6)-L-threonylcarbamoyladenosine(37)-C(2))-methylthiotransferase MtaB [Campylobacter sp. CN_NA1]MDA3065868.1 tRNA (N(6)-L-threonylcarbamoyladenosine(37)-C(2))-methylthiotransferase MtaB [Campylobacter sp. CN_NE4]MDA3068702.1 tRNA (N(6)-L-threonylcarbamoyladenosine(37)-C(2))-methylthiotransferase MtaB [Campylobacter sp. CN_NE3]MDA3081975.1 tRNA (N(6)-L-thr